MRQIAIALLAALCGVTATLMVGSLRAQTNDYYCEVISNCCNPTGCIPQSGSINIPTVGVINYDGYQVFSYSMNMCFDGGSNACSDNTSQLCCSTAYFKANSEETCPNPSIATNNTNANMCQY